LQIKNTIHTLLWSGGLRGEIPCLDIKKITVGGIKDRIFRRLDPSRKGEEIKKAAALTMV
jgi:hypothetical protein